MGLMMQCKLMTQNLSLKMKITCQSVKVIHRFERTANKNAMSCGHNLTQPSMFPSIHPSSIPASSCT